MTNKHSIYPLLLFISIAAFCLKTQGQCITNMIGTFANISNSNYIQNSTVSIDTTESGVLDYIGYSENGPIHGTFSNISCSNNTFQYLSGTGCVWVQGTGSYSNDYNILYVTYATWNSDGYVCCSVSDTFTRIGPPTGIVQIKNISPISVYPNPFHNSTNIRLTISQKYFLELDDISGRKLQWIEFTGNQYVLSTQGFANGLYFIRLFDYKNNLIGTAKIVAQ